MTIIEATKVCLTQKYFTFSGRAARKEFWLFVLVLSIISSLITSYVNSSEGSLAIRVGLNIQVGPDVHWMENLFSVLVFIPFVAALTRRVHDTGTSGKKALVYVFAIFLVLSTAFILPWQIPVIGAALLVLYGIYYLCKPSDPGPNRFGPYPYEVTP